MKILITGFRGFIGSHLFNKLKKQGHNVLGIDKKHKNQNLSNFATINTIIQDFKPDVVIHLAAVLNNNQLENLIDNIVSSVNVFEACKKNKVPWVIFTSSAAVYGEQNQIVTEASPTNPINVYGSSKQYIENIMLTYNFRPTILRLSNVYGIGGKGVINKFLYLLKNNMFLKVCGDGMQVRDFIHIDDVMGFFDLVLAGKLKGLFNVGTGRGIRVTQLINLLNKFKESSCKFVEAPKNEIRFSCLRSRYMLYRYKIKLEDGMKDLWEKI